MPERLAQQLLTHVTARRKSQTIADLAESLGLKRADVQDAVRHLQQEGHVVLDADEAVVLPPPGKELEGEFRAHERGFGFFIPDRPLQHGDLFVPPNATMKAMTGDRVRVKVQHEKGRDAGDPSKSPYVAKVVEILSRSERSHTGTLRKKGKRYIVEMDGTAFEHPVVVKDPSVKGAAPGDKVVVDLVSWPERRGDVAEGVITRVLGEAGEPDVETAAVILSYGLRDAFDDAVTDDARAAARTFDDDAVPADRLDLTNTFICTIDPPSAKDFDDAINVTKYDQPQQDGAVWELGVHIADVAHFVRPGTELDDEAYRRGNSTYLPRRVLPMLPEVLSNGVCSLSSGVNRFAKSCFIRYSAGGKVVSARFARSVIRSAKRMTYLEAQALIDDDLREAAKHVKTEANFPRELIKTCKQMDELARLIRKRRLKAGMIVLGLPDVELIYDESGRVVDAEPEDDAFTHTIIEMFMVEANEAAARLFDTLDVPMIRRTHPDPERTDYDELRGYAQVAGIKVPKAPTRQDLQHILERTRGTPNERSVHLAVLKTLMRAEYSPALIGHYALASEHYAHFTSPIRRYPDLIVHRGLDAYLDATDNGQAKQLTGKRVAQAVHDDERTHPEPELRDIGHHCSTTERNSAAAEKELRMYLILELLAEHVGEDFPGVVTGITNRGVFVQIEKYLIDGFILAKELPSLPGERWEVNERNGTMVAQRSGKVLGMGHEMTVRIAKVDLARRNLELVVIDLGKTRSASGKPSRAQKQREDRRKPKGKATGKAKAGDKQRDKPAKKKKRGQKKSKKSTDRKRDKPNHRDTTAKKKKRGQKKKKKRG